MPDLPEPMTRQQLLEDFAREWDALMNVVNAADEQSLLERTDAAGWNARDHLANLSMWLQSVISMVRDGKPQWVGLGISEELFRRDDDEINSELWLRYQGTPYANVLSEFSERHQTMIALIQGLSDEQLLRPASSYDSTSKDVSICYFIDGDGPYHYRQHRGWIKKILSS